MRARNLAFVAGMAFAAPACGEGLADTVTTCEPSIQSEVPTTYQHVDTLSRLAEELPLDSQPVDLTNDWKADRVDQHGEIACSYEGELYLTFGGVALLDALIAEGII